MKYNSLVKELIMKGRTIITFEVVVAICMILMSCTNKCNNHTPMKCVSERIISETIDSLKSLCPEPMLSVWIRLDQTLFKRCRSSISICRDTASSFVFILS